MRIKLPIPSVTMLMAFIALMSFSGCGGKRMIKSPVDELIKQYYDYDAFSIILYDMEVEGSFVKDYKQQYHVIYTKGEETEETKTGWYEVSEAFFQKHSNNMGMELAAKANGKISKVPSPPGYYNYVGNTRYGGWHNHNGSDFWSFYGRYAFMNSMFNTMTTPIPRTYYRDYHDNYRGRNSYYGPTTGGKKYYGTGSSYTSTSRKDSKWRRSGSAMMYRNTSRYSGSSSSSGYARKSGGGFGK